MTLCGKENGHYQKTCIDRTCEICGPKTIAEHLKEAKDMGGDEDIRYGKWDKLANNRKRIREEYTSFSRFIEELLEELQQFSKHLVNAQWQAKQFTLLKETLPSGCVLQVLDFAENYTCIHQDEIQSAHSLVP